VFLFLELDRLRPHSTVSDPATVTPTQNNENAALADALPKRPQGWLEQVREAAELACQAHGVELFDIEWAQSPRGRILRVFVYRSEAAEKGQPETPRGSGVTITDCVRVSRDLSTVLDALDTIREGYSLEVSSPGLDRPLQSIEDYGRQLGKLAKLKLHEQAVDGQMALRGTIVSTHPPANVTMLVDGKEHDVRLDNVREAKLVFELGGGKKTNQNQPKKGRKTRRKKRR
jgi:ribosome maturation factor RimP